MTDYSKNDLITIIGAPSRSTHSTKARSARVYREILVVWLDRTHPAKPDIKPCLHLGRSFWKGLSIFQTRVRASRVTVLTPKLWTVAALALSLGLTACASPRLGIYASLGGFEAPNVQSISHPRRASTKAPAAGQDRRQKNECVGPNSATRLLCKGFFGEGGGHD